MASNHTLIIQLLRSKGLHLMAMVYDYGESRYRDRLCRMVHDSCDIDIEDHKALSELTDDQDALLVDFENEHYELLSKWLKTPSRDDTITETVKKTSNSKTMLLVYWFGIILAGLAVAYVCAITWIPIPEQNLRFADTSLGFILGSMLSTIIQYFFGTSMRKTDYHSVSDVKRTSNEMCAPDQNKIKNR